MRVVAAGLAALVPACVATVDLGGGTTSEVKTDPNVHTELPAVPAMTNVVPTVTTDTVGIDFDPVDGALDYRVYPLPPDSDVTVNPDHSVTIRNAVYRCAGARQTFVSTSRCRRASPPRTGASRSSSSPIKIRRRRRASRTRTTTRSSSSCAAAPKSAPSFTPCTGS